MSATTKQQHQHPAPSEIVRLIGDTSDRAIRYVQQPDPKLTRLPRRYREEVITDIPPVTAGALLGTAALARHFVASAATGRYRDLFNLWDLFRSDPQTCKPVLADRPEALDKARQRLRTAVRLGVRGHTDLLAEDITRAQGLIWQWLREILDEDLHLIGARPAIASALLLREPDLEIELPQTPDGRWLSEAAAAADNGPLAPAVEKVFGAHLEQLPGTVATLSLARERFPDKVPSLIERAELDSPEVGALLAWARDHGQAERLQERIRERVDEQAAADLQQGLTAWWVWRERGVPLELPRRLRGAGLDAFDLTRPETAELAAILMADGAQVEPQGRLDDLAAQNRQLAEKAYEAFVCAGHDVHLPEALRDNQIVKEGTRCPWCEAWTWVRPGHERRCPRAAAGEPVVRSSASAPEDEWVIDEGSDSTPPPASADAPGSAAAAAPAVDAAPGGSASVPSGAEPAQSSPPAPPTAPPTTPPVAPPAPPASGNGSLQPPPPAPPADTGTSARER